MFTYSHSEVIVLFIVSLVVVLLIVSLVIVLFMVMSRVLFMLSFMVVLFVIVMFSVLVTFPISAKAAPHESAIKREKSTIPAPILLLMFYTPLILVCHYFE
jgi:hypothetical protein